MDNKTNAFLETEPLGKLMARYAVPCVISFLVAALYNIVDQIFIANADYLGSYGNAANTVVFPLTVVALTAVSFALGMASPPIIKNRARPIKERAPAIGSKLR